MKRIWGQWQGRCCFEIKNFLLNQSITRRDIFLRFNAKLSENRMNELRRMLLHMLQAAAERYLL